MALLTDPRGREEELTGTAELEKLFDVPFAVVATLINRGLFPDPVSAPLADGLLAWRLYDAADGRKIFRALVGRARLRLLETPH